MLAFVVSSGASISRPLSLPGLLVRPCPRAMRAAAPARGAVPFAACADVRLSGTGALSSLAARRSASMGVAACSRPQTLARPGRGAAPGAWAGGPTRRVGAGGRRGGVVVPAAAAAAEPRASSSAPSSSDAPPPLLVVRNLRARIVATGREVLKGVNLELPAGETHVIMGQNGSGKSTLTKVLVGHPDYEVLEGEVLFKGEDLLGLEPEERARRGVFLSFQSPVEIPGVSTADFLRAATNARREHLGLPALDPLEFFAHVSPRMAALGVDPTFLDRSVNAGFSGGEKKRAEVLQMSCLEPELALLDEIDSGLDVDALRDVAKAVCRYKTEKPELGILMITHYRRLLDLIPSDRVHLFREGKVVRSGGMELVHALEDEGYQGLFAGEKKL